MERYPSPNLTFGKPSSTLNNSNQGSLQIHSVLRQPIRTVSQQNIPTIVSRQTVSAPNPDPVLIVAEIRMGLRKFETTSHNSKVTFQDDGIMFHVKSRYH